MEARVNAEELEVLLEITLGSKMASEVTWAAGGDPAAAAEDLHRRAGSLVAPFRSGKEAGNRSARVRKDAKRLQLVARLVEEMAYELNEEYDVELVRSA